MSERPAIPTGGSVPADYLHRAKVSRPGAELAVAGGYFKWYEIAPAQQPVPAEVATAAREHLAAEAAAGRLAFDREVGFVVLHRCGELFHYLLVTTWRGSNELWATVYYTDGAGFLPGRAFDSHRGTYCVWELGAIDHERQAWSRFLSSGRDAQALNTYLDDTFSGTV
ncbi:hypothetical protein [Kitasatospora sp. LaBMicrA B282]|uniref:hypothetical protein n=1 Tax=Kitasatospora sp. LaBMicrA B282 TaxID=3420949 RepID=UPI003D0B6C93